MTPSGETRLSGSRGNVRRSSATGGTRPQVDPRVTARAEHGAHGVATRSVPRRLKGEARWPGRAGVKRLVPVLIAGLVLYGVAPAVLEVLGAYRRLGNLDPMLSIAVLATSAAGIWCMCALQRMALNGAGWFSVITSQLAGTAFSKVVPGGSAAAAALQARMLVQAGVAPAEVGIGLTAGPLLLLGALAGLPLLALPAVLLGRHIPDGLLQAGAIGLAVFVVLFAIGALLFANDGVLRAIGRGLRTADRKLRRRHAPSDELPERLLTSATSCGGHSDGRGRGRLHPPRADGSSISFRSTPRYWRSVRGHRCRSRCLRTARRSCSARSR